MEQKQILCSFYVFGFVPDARGKREGISKGLFKWIYLWMQIGCGAHVVLYRCLCVDVSAKRNLDMRAQLQILIFLFSCDPYTNSTEAQLCK